MGHPTTHNRVVSTALECKEVWCNILLSGDKVLEVRQYPLDEELFTHRIYLIATQGPEGIGALENQVPANSPLGYLAGWVSFNRVVEYRCKDVFNTDYDKHKVDEGSMYGWKEDTKVLYGWQVQSYCKFDKPCPLPALRRRFRSLYSVAD